MTRRDYDPAALGRAMYPLLNSVVVPRPIAWVSSRSPSGVDNLAPHSFFTVSCVTPPVVQFTSVGEKDSLRNVRESGEFVVCLCPEELVEQVNLTGTDYPADVSEFDAVPGLTREPSRLVAPPRVAESPVALECRVVGMQQLGDSTVVFGEVVWAVVDERVLRDDRPEVTLLKPLSRLGANEWATVGTVSTRRRIPFGEVRETGSAQGHGA